MRWVIAQEKEMIVVFKKIEKLYRKNLNYDLAFCIIQLVKGINYRL